MILASGLDTRAYRLAWPRARWSYEIDQPKVIEFKTRDAGRPRRRASANDGRSPSICARLAVGAAQVGFDAGVPTAWSAEGLLAYLPPERRIALRQHHRSVHPAAADHVEYMDMVTASDWAGEADRAVQAHRLVLNLAELIYTGERNSAADYLTAPAGRCAYVVPVEASAANGFELPDDNGGVRRQFRISHGDPEVEETAWQEPTATPGTWPPASARPRRWSRRSARWATARS